MSIFVQYSLILQYILRGYSIIIVSMFNGKGNTTFAAIKSSKGINEISFKNPQPTKTFIPVPKSFKEIAVKKASHAKSPIQNQQNQPEHTFVHSFKQNVSGVRKNILKFNPDSKRSGCQLFKSPSHKNFQTRGFLQPIQLNQNANYQIPSMHKNANTVCSFDKATLLTPNLTKNRNSIHQSCDIYKDDSFYTQRNIYECSEKDSVNLSSRNSVEDLQGSFNDEESKHSRKKIGDSVNSSLDLQKELTQMNLKIKNLLDNSLHSINDNLDSERTMKKHSAIFSSYSAIGNCNDTTLDLADKDHSVSNSVHSINFSQKFKHYKKQTQSSFHKKEFKLTDFQLIDEIGAGKYGKVFLARHNQTGFICAIKCVSKKIIQQEQIEVPFIRQVKIQMYLNHPNIVKMYGFFHDQQNIYLMLEYCSGGHLLKLMKTKSSFQQTQILQILSNIFEAVSFIHCHGIIHRDLKPENVVIQHNVYKLCDFGWAAYACGDNRTTFCGTPLYVSPQILKGEEYNSKADVWGLGIIFYELAFGRVPFPIWSQTDMIKIVKDPVYFPSWSGASEKMIHLIRSMLNKNPDERASLNQILSHDLMRDHFCQQKGIKNQIDRLFL